MAAIVLLGACQAPAHRAGPTPSAPHTSPSVSLSPASPTPSTTALPALAPFGSAFQAYADSREGEVTAALFDVVTGRTYRFHPAVRIDTASVVKVAIMAAVLRNAELAGRSLTTTEAGEMTSMIESSDNDAATDLWNEIGGRDGMTAFLQAAGLSQTVTDPAGHWGLTQTSALDQVALMKDFVLPSSLLDDSSRAYGLSLMEHVIPQDDFGVSDGLPSDVTVALKNGWLAVGDADWVVNSVGYVDGQARRYVLAILSDGSPTFAYGAETIAGMSTFVWQALKP